MTALALALALFAADPAAACDGCAAHAAPAAAPAAAPEPARPPSSFAEKPAVGTPAYCPVMEEPFTVESDTPMEQYEGRWYAFCCQPCVKKFKANPAKYAEPSA